MTAKVISKATIYGSNLEGHEEFRTECEHHAEAHDYVHGVEAAICERLKGQERFTDKARFEGELSRLLEEHIWFETQRRMSTPTDHFGMDTTIKEVITIFANKGMPVIDPDKLAQATRDALGTDPDPDGPEKAGLTA